MVIALADFQRFEIRLDILADGFRLDEVHRSAGDIRRLAQRDLGRIRGEILGGVQLQFVVQDGAGGLAVQVEIDVVRQVHDRGGVRFRRQNELELVVLAPLVVRDGFQVAGESGFAILGEIHEFDGVAFDAAIPDLVREAVRAAVEVVGAVVDWEMVLHAVQRELAVRDAVRKAAGHLAAARSVADVVQRIRVAQHDVAEFAVLVRDDDRDDRRADVGQLYVCAGGVLEGIAEDFLSVRGGRPQFFGDFHIGCVSWFRVLQI